ncbi:MAG TPA: PAS domain S-box protein [Bacteroidota bacterium]|nr:PAS domain S-box protein [Bacteroidota bacterium]
MTTVAASTEKASALNVLPFSPAPRIERPSIPFTAEMLFHKIWEGSGVGKLLTDEDGLIVMVNSTFSRMAGLTENAMLGRPFTVAYPGIQGPERTLASYRRRFRARQVSPVIERRRKSADGSIESFEVSSSFVQNEEGKTLLLTNFRDVTNQRNAERALKESESKYRSLFANSIQPMFVSSIAGRFVNANGSLLKLLGYDSFLELANLDIANDVYAHSNDRTSVTEMLLRKGYVRNLEIRLKRKNGEVITVIEHARTLIDENGRVEGFEGTMEDVTAKKELEVKIEEYVKALEDSQRSLKELNAQKDKLFSILSHDLRSPFGSILGFCDLLINERETLSEQEQMQFLKFINDSAKDQLALVTKLLDWSRLETGRVKMDSKLLSLDEIATKSIRTLMGLSKQKRVDVESRLTGGMTIQGDEEMLLQVFNNLIGNALKFTPAGGQITIEQGPKIAGKWTVVVRDTGMGIPEKDIHKLFKIEEKYTRKGLNGEKGTGLGLPVCQEIMEKHNSSITVSSVVGHGTAFTLTFPATIPSAAGNVIIADDDEGVRILHTRYMKRLWPNATVLHASDGQEILDLVKKVPVDLILSDHDMPKKNGLEVIAELKKDPATRDIPFLLVTGRDSDASHKAFIENGAMDVLTKPVAPELLAVLLAELQTGKQ